MAHSFGLLRARMSPEAQVSSALKTWRMVLVMRERYDGTVDLEAALKDALAAYAHETWSHWMRFMFGVSTHHADGSVGLPPALVERWKRQMQTPYADLPTSEQGSDQEQAQKILDVFWATCPGSPKDLAPASGTHLEGADSVLL